ncbi:hypothetical protein ACTL6P_24275 [Endozoicomonas acroporae]|uniref:hypothetical protein n=1 Tax=Endozoicomonas acroporae TaxID=1701104 RepID=UPI000C7658BD|nr:hypothetical protein [Endozoicomonas acroporae]
MPIHEEVRKISTGYRILAFFITFSGLLALASALLYGMDEELSIGFLLMFIVPTLLIYIFGLITFTGYPPKVLLWTLEKK